MFTNHFSRVFIAASLCLMTALPVPVLALASQQVEVSESGDAAAGAAAAAMSASQKGTDQSAVKADTGAEEKPVLIAQQSCASCGAEISTLAVGGGTLASGKKNKDLMTDSLWGNLILELAYQRDNELQKIAKHLGLVGLGTNAAIGMIAGGTLAQGISALQTLNPPPGIQDSYTPGAIGVALSGCTILTFATSMYLRHHMNANMRKRQYELRDKVEGILNHLEQSNSTCVDAQNELTALIGKRACGEWLQLWRSSHQIAMTQAPKISLKVEGAKDKTDSPD